MRIVHVSDLHLGFRSTYRTAQSGLNMREIDIARAFSQFVTKCIALAPDVILICGDVFHGFRPPNPAVIHAMTEFSRLVKALPDAIVVMPAGNHDQPKAIETGCILPLFAPLGIHVVERQARRISFPDRDLSILAVPDGAACDFNPDPAFRYNVMALHGALEEVYPAAARGDRSRLTAVDMHANARVHAGRLTTAHLKMDQWSYIGLGDYHVHRVFAPNCCYSGATEYTSSNIWGEIREQAEREVPGKGFVEYDLTTKALTFHPLTAARAIIDLPPIDASGMDAPAVSHSIRQQSAAVPGGVAGAIVRQVVTNLPVEVSREIDHKMMRSLKANALFFMFDPRRPERGSFADGVARAAVRQRMTVAEMFEAYTRKRIAASPIAGDVEAVVALGLDYLQEAERKEIDAGAAADVDEPVTPERQEIAA